MAKFNDNFWRWFGKSKVVDANGNPQVVYHATGSPKDFYAFKRKLNDLGMHFGTLGQAEDRMNYMQEKRPSESWRIIPVYLSIKNPIRLDDHGHWNWENIEYQIGERVGKDAVKQAIRSVYSANGKTAAIRDLLEARGCDGIVYKNTGETAGAIEYRRASDEAWKKYDAWQKKKVSIRQENYGDDRESEQYQNYTKALSDYEKFRAEHAEDSWIAFRPEQVKSAVGNDGSWDPKSKDMRSNPSLESEAEQILRRAAR